jgi:hypothetical protein
MDKQFTVFRGIHSATAFFLGLQVFGQMYSQVYDAEELGWSNSSAPYEDISVEACGQKACGRDYDTVIVNTGNELNFKMLREYIERKERAALALWRAEAGVVAQYVEKDTLVAREGLSQLMRVKGNSSNDSMALEVAKQTLSTSNSLFRFLYWRDREESRGVTEANFEAEILRSNLTQYLTDARSALKSLPNLRLSLVNVKHDLDRAKNQLERTLDPSQREQEFRQQISSKFAFLLGGFVLIFFLIVFIRGGKNVSRMLMNNNGLQFITLFSLIISIVLFGILGILKGSELAAILSGISGYILGQNRGSWAPGDGSSTAGTTVVPAAFVQSVQPIPTRAVDRVDPPRGTDTSHTSEVG